MKRRKIMIDLRIAGLKCLIAIAVSLAFISHAQAAVDVLDLWNFNNSVIADGSFPGVYYASPGGTDAAYYDGTSMILNASSGVFATSLRGDSTPLSRVDVSTLGVMGYGGGTRPAGWGSFAGTTGGTDHALAIETYNYVNGSVYNTVTYTGPTTLVTNNGNYLEFDLATTGYKNIKLTYDYRATSTSFSTQDWQYSGDGGATWTDFSTLTASRTSTFFTGNIVNFYSANSALTDKPDVRFRVYLNGASTATNPANTRLDNVKFTGLSMSSAQLTWNPLSSNTWNTTNTNWLNGSTSTHYTEGDVVEFTDAGLAAGSTINVTAGLNPGEIHVTNTNGVYTFSGASLNGSFDLIKTGTGAVAFSVANTSYSGNISINEGTMQVGADINPTTGILYLNGGTLQRTSGGDVLFSKNINFSGPSKIDTNGGNLELSGALTSSYNVMALTKTGAGTLTLNGPDSNPPGYFHGNVDVQAGTLRLNQVNFLGYTAIGDGSVKVEQGATFQVDNITYGIPSSGYFDLYNGGTLLGTNNARLEYGNVSVVAAASGPNNMVDLKTPDIMYLGSAVQQYSTNYTKPTNATIRVDTPGRVVLQSGGISSQLTFGGDWELDNGVLQIGPVEENDPLPGDTFNGPHGEPLNALGFKVPTTPLHGSNDADPDLPNAITVKGGILAIAVDAHNNNPNNTAFPANNTPDYIRNPVILAGGKIAATGYEVSYSDPEHLGKPTTTPVKAELGGSFTVAAGISQVLTYDPVGSTGARTVELVGGTRTLTANSPGFNANDAITYSTNWIGTLQVNAGGTTGGSFNIKRVGGTVSVTPGATLEILAGATVNLSGANALSDGTNSVNIVDNGLFDVVNGNHQAGDISGSGTVVVEHDTTLTVQSIKTSTLSMGAGATLTILPIPGGYNMASSTSLTPVPEPSTLVLLSLAALAGLFRMYFRIKR